MKGNTLVVGMAFLLAAISLVVAWYAFQFVQLTRTLRQAEFVLSQIELRQTRLKAMINESVDFSQRNAAINPILYAAGVKQPPAIDTPTRPTPPTP